MANILTADDPACASYAADLLARGEIICYPTDTVYGIGAAASNDQAVRRLYAVKGRPLSKPLPLLIADSAAASFIAEVTPLARNLMARFWPGPLTIVLRKHAGFRSLALAVGDTVALRVPDADIVRAIVRLLGEPITGTSANRAGARPPVAASEVALQLGDMVALVVDGGRAAGGLESTVIDITNAPALIRQGPVTQEQLEEAMGRKLAVA